ncbi:hypothetical protein MtrunA17_Chr3g0140751 [Medicago truncatula]|uniref:Uncharacterized protein n=1 Tax=Medicago truncatula TaxID=3880 RepID=A0A396J3A7_MEDTR|nr:hypothetical protein MtrunA17_Chr3g0140751 [Medicago truncatula]
MIQCITQLDRSTRLPLTHDKCLNKTLCSISLLRGSRYYNFSFHSSRDWISNNNICIRDLICFRHSPFSPYISATRARGTTTSTVVLVIIGWLPLHDETKLLHKQ